MDFAPDYSNDFLLCDSAFLHYSKKVTGGIHAKIPLIVYNGAFVIDNVTEEILIANYFDESVLCENYEN